MSAKPKREFAVGLRLPEPWKQELDQIGKAVGLRASGVMRVAIHLLLHGAIDPEALPLIPSEPGPVRTRRLTIRLPPDVREAFRQYCRARGAHQELVLSRIALGLTRGGLQLRIPPAARAETDREEPPGD